MVIPQDKQSLQGPRKDDLRRSMILYLVAGVLCLLAEILLFNCGRPTSACPSTIPIATDLLHIS